MKSIKALTTGISILVVFTLIISAAAIVNIDGSDAAITPATKDASGSDMKASYDTTRIMTIGVGTLRWVSYFGHSANVVCIDAGDANNASWNGKAYRSLFSFDGAGLASQMSGGTINPTESHITTYRMACHNHNGFSSDNLTALGAWTSHMPTVAIVSKTVYDSFNDEIKTGLAALTDVVVIEEVDVFLDEQNNLSTSFNNNLSILAKVFNDTDRANAIVNSVNTIVNDIKSLTEGKTCKFNDAYIGSAAAAGAKTLTWSVGDYVPFKLAGVKNGYEDDHSTATDAGSEAMSKATPSVIFLDLSGTTKYSDDGSSSVLTYASMNKTPMYTLLPYFWFGFNFDNALADAYLVIYACYDDALPFEQCLEKIKAVYKAFYPEMTNGGAALTGFDNYYSKTGSKLTLDGIAYNYEDSAFKAVDRPAGDTSSPNNNNTPVIIGAVIGAVAIIALAGVFLLKRK